MIRLTAVIELEGQAPRALTHESNARTVILGRDSSADFQIPLTTVSRQHARISETDGVYVFEDLGSTHGSLLNGKKIEPGEKKVLRDGDIVELTKARITCNVEQEKVAGSDPSEGTQAIASKAVAGILGRLGDAQGEGPYVRVLNGPDEGQRLVFGGTQTEWSMGRSRDCELVLNDVNISRRHAVVKKDWSGFLIEDLGSKNGILVNERRVDSRRRLKDQDEITVGPIRLLFIDPDADLIASLADVPGFESPEVEPPPEELGEAPSVLGAPSEDDSEVGPGLSYEGDGLDNPLPDGEGMGDDEKTSGYEEIDPELLAADKSRVPTEWIIIGVVGVIAALCVLLLLLIL